MAEQKVLRHQVKTDVFDGNNVSLALSRSNNEIDLIALLSLLGQVKKQLIMFTFLCALIGVAVSFLLPQKWTSEAVVTPAESFQLEALKSQLISMNVLGVVYHADSHTLFQSFLKRFDSQSLKASYLSHSPFILSQLNGAKYTANDLHRSVVQVSDKLTSESNVDVKHPEKSPYESWTLKFTAPDAQDAQQVLDGYIEYVTREVVAEEMKIIQSNLALSISNKQRKLSLERARLENARNVAIQRLNYSLAIANAAGIKDPVYSNGQAVKDDPDFSIALGARGLAEKLSIEKSIHDVAELNADLLNQQHVLSQLKAIEIKDIDFSPFRYQMPPSLPIKRDGISRIFLVVLAALFGACAFCIWVFGKEAMQNQARLIGGRPHPAEESSL